MGYRRTHQQEGRRSRAANPYRSLGHEAGKQGVGDGHRRRSEVGLVKRAGASRPRMVVVYAGHSFVRRSKCAMVGGSHIPTQYQDVQHRSQAAELAHHYKVGYRVSEVYTMARGIVHAGDLNRHIDDILEKDPNMILLEVGTNSLSTMDDDVTDAQVYSVALYVKALAAIIPPHITVVCMGVVPRESPTMSCTVESFTKYAGLYNGFLKQFAEESHRGQIPTNFRYQKPQGWWTQELPDGSSVPCPVDDWICGDMIHPTREAFLTKHARTVKKAILNPRNLPTNL